MKTLEQPQQTAEWKRFAESPGSVLWLSPSGQLYRQPQYQAGKLDSWGVPLGARWECTLGHFNHYRARGVYSNYTLTQP